MAARAVGARVTTQGKKLTRDVFYVANHVSWIDILAMGGASGCAFISKDDVAAWPIIGWLAAQNNTVFIGRDKRRDVTAHVDLVRIAMERHQPITLFPEGTTGDGISLLPFKPALFAVMLPPPRALRVQPVYIDYGKAAHDIAWFGEESAGANAVRVVGRKGPLPITLHFLEPFDPSEHPDRKAISAEAQKRIENCHRAFASRPADV